jgi:outer membrane protein
MKNTLKTLLVSFVLGAAALQAQPALKVAVVDMASLYDKHYLTEQQNAKLEADEKRAQEELQRLNTEGNTIVTAYQELLEQMKNPVLSNDAKAKLEQDAQKKLEEIQAKQNEVQAFRQNVQRTLQAQIGNFRDLLLEDLGKLATEIAKQKGATVLIDKSAPAGFGISNFIYVDPAYDITEEVMAAVNKNRPAGSAAPAAAPAAPASDAPAISFPGASKK